MSLPILQKITIHPIKALSGQTLQEAFISEGGCLLHDREFAMFDVHGKYVNGKANPLVHRLHSSVDFERKMMSFKAPTESSWNEFDFENDLPKVESYLSDYFREPIKLVRDKTGRFLDVPDNGGVTVVSAESLRSAATWFPPLSVDETRRRFRVTLEFDGVSAFWEDQLFSGKGHCVEFKVGDVSVYGMSPCARCVVPSRNPDTAEVLPAFQKAFSEKRKATQPLGSKLKDYGHHYHFSVNCLIPPSEVGKKIKVGDELFILGEKLIPGEI
ncbi:MAG: MOSC N-terminal beta barrel domain-containing protein [Bacteroidetes bacterium]|nr:MOSC N-terminal beta barrel domain-containing protein [Bacteroidota bacterium]